MKKNVNSVVSKDSAISVIQRLKSQKLEAHYKKGGWGGDNVGIRGTTNSRCNEPTVE